MTPEQKIEGKSFEPELFCLRCQNMEWDEEQRACANYQTGACPLSIRQVLAGINVSCLVF